MKHTLLLFIGYSQKMNKKFIYAYHYLSNTETIIKAINEETERNIADVELPPDWEERSKIVWERISKSIEKMEQGNA